MQNPSKIMAIAAGRNPKVDKVPAVHQSEGKRLLGEALKHFKDDDHFRRNIEECFFGQRFILVEGREEAELLPYTADLLKLSHDSCAIIDCGSKYNLHHYMETLNKLGLSYVVVHDGDPLPTSPSVPSSAQMDIFNENDRIAKCAQLNPANLVLISNPNLDSVAEIERGPKGPFSIRETFGHRVARGIPARLKDLVEKAFGAQWTVKDYQATVISI